MPHHTDPRLAFEDLAQADARQFADNEPAAAMTVFLRSDVTA
jgi:hypothetical protein